MIPLDSRTEDGRCGHFWSGEIARRRSPRALAAATGDVQQHARHGKYGAQTALGSWQASAPAAKQKKQRRKNKGAGGDSNSLVDGDAGSTASSASAAYTSVSKAAITNASLPSHAALTTQSSGLNSLVNGDLSSSYGYGPPTTEIVKAAMQHTANTAAPKPQRNQQQQRGGPGAPTNNGTTTQRSTGKVVANGRDSKQMAPIGSQRHPPPPSNTAFLNGDDDHLNTDDKRKALTKEMKNLGRHDATVDHIQNSFNMEVDKARERMRRAFQEVRQRFAERESHLAAELERCKEDGHRLLAERNAKGKELNHRASRVAAMSDRELNELRAEIKTFVAERRYEEELGQAIRFQWESDHVVQMIKNFGEVVPVKPISAHKHSSHSSLVSSVGEDSGLGMVSPVSPATETKPMAQVRGGGMEMKSDSLTADQLEDLNRRLQESLRAQGIDASVLEGVGGSTAMPPRRRPPTGPTGERRGRGGRGGGSRGGRGGQQHHHGAAPSARQPELSIFQD
uniref:Uncharacterized protein n=1 Tax=Plectus sambesii TaxID=2011161 RepID=A0A914XAD9_9BILA